MRLISEIEINVVSGAGRGATSSTATPLSGGGVNTSSTTNGTITDRTVFPNGNSTTTITRPDGHGEIITTTVTNNRAGSGQISGSGAIGSGNINGTAGGGTTVTTIKTSFLAEEPDPFWP